MRSGRSQPQIPCVFPDIIVFEKFSGFVPRSRVYRRMAGAVFLSWLSCGLCWACIGHCSSAAGLYFHSFRLGDIVSFPTLPKTDLRYAVVGMMSGYLTLLGFFAFGSPVTGACFCPLRDVVLPHRVFHSVAFAEWVRSVS